MTKIHSWFMGSLKSLGKDFHSSVAHIDCLLCSSQLHFTATVVLGSFPLDWHLQNASVYCCNSTALHLVCSLWPLHAYKTSTTLVILTLPSSATSEWPLIGHLWNKGCADPGETLLRFPFIGPVSSITDDFVSPARGHQLPQCRKLLLSNASLLLLPADSFALADQNHRCLVQNIRQPW